MLSGKYILEHVEFKLSPELAAILVHLVGNAQGSSENLQNLLGDLYGELSMHMPAANFNRHNNTFTVDEITYTTVQSAVLDVV